MFRVGNYTNPRQLLSDARRQKRISSTTSFFLTQKRTPNVHSSPNFNAFALHPTPARPFQHQKFVERSSLTQEISVIECGHYSEIAYTDTHPQLTNKSR